MATKIDDFGVSGAKIRSRDDVREELGKVNQEIKGVEEDLCLFLDDNREANGKDRVAAGACDARTKLAWLCILVRKRDKLEGELMGR